MTDIYLIGDIKCMDLKVTLILIVCFYLAEFRPTLNSPVPGQCPQMTVTTPPTTPRPHTKAPPPTASPPPAPPGQSPPNPPPPQSHRKSQHPNNPSPLRPTTPAGMAKTFAPHRTLSPARRSGPSEQFTRPRAAREQVVSRAPVVRTCLNPNP